MRRRRLILVGLVVLAALGLYVGWLNRLTEEERQILGTWYRRSPNGLTRLDFFPDRTHSVYFIDERTGVALWTPESLQLARLEWRVRDGKIIETPPLGFVGRLRGLLPAGFPGALSVVTVPLVVERVTADELIIRDKYENICRMTRTPPD
jgi:hypothetical protein